MKKSSLAAMRAAFPHTIPVLTGFGFLGMTYGILLASKGYGPMWAFLMSFFVYAGSMQYLALSLLTAAFDPIAVFFLTLTVNARHLFYGISLLEPFRSLGRARPYLIFALTDETFSLFCSANPPEGVDREQFFVWIALLNQFYWVSASVIGGLIGSVLTLNTTGFDFVLTALFVVIFLSQWQDHTHRIPALVGLGCSLLCLLIFGSGNFLLPAMAAILALLLLIRKPLEKRTQGGTAK